MRSVIKEINKRVITGKFNSKKLSVERFINKLSLYSSKKIDKKDFQQLSIIRNRIDKCKF